MWRRLLHCFLRGVLGVALASCGSRYGETAGEDPELEARDAADVRDANAEDPERSRDASTEAEEASLPGDECAGAMTVDQENLPYEERTLLTSVTPLSQSFIVSRDASLARIEVLLQVCNYLPRPDDRVRIDVFDGVQRIASALAPLAQPATKCRAITDDLLPFDFGEACVALKAQRLYSYTLSAVTTDTSVFEAEIAVNHQNTYANGNAKVGGAPRAMDDYVFRILIR